MLSEHDLNIEIQNGRVFDPESVAKNAYKVQSSSIDLSVKKIHIPDCKNSNKTRKSHLLQPGETVILELNENFELTNELGGIVFPRNTLSKNGIVMTNPGHIDPGYKGIISVYLVNMSKEPFPISENSAVAKLLLFKTSTLTSGYQGKAVTTLDEEQLDRMGKDFAGLDSRIPSEITKILRKWTFGLLTIAAIMISMISIAIPILFQIVSNNFDKTKDLQLIISQQEEEINKLKIVTTMFNNQLSRLPDANDTIQQNQNLQGNKQ
ncbi:dCTP deaminase [Morganella morganii]|uniref:dCTP deaminase n=1 Tax=Morganella morganii TaxID=582 RepID=UPI003EBA47C5